MELSPLGLEQAAALAAWIRRLTFDAVYASPMKRAQQTLAALALAGMAKTITKPDLREVDFGDWTGLGWDEVLDRFRVHARDWLERLDSAAIPNGESGVAFRERVEPCLREIIGAHPGQNVAIVAHGGVIRMMLAILLELPLSKMTMFEVDYASVTHVALSEHGAEIQLLNLAPWRDSLA